jgi:hypothetical protein
MEWRFRKRSESSVVVVEVAEVMAVVTVIHRGR